MIHIYRTLLLIITLLISSNLMAQKVKLVSTNTLSGHQGQVEYVTFNASGTKIASGGSDNRIYLWDPFNGSITNILEGHTGLINHLVFNQTGNLLASASNDGTVKLWDVQTGQLLQTFLNALPTSSYKAAYFVLFGPNEQYLYFGGKNHKLNRGEIGKNLAPEVIYENVFVLTSAVLTPDKQSIAFAAGKNIFFLNLATQKMVASIKNTQDYINDIQVSNTGNRIAAWSEDGTLYLWDFPSNQLLYGGKAGDAGYSHIFFSKDDRYIVSGNAGNSVKVWDITTGQARLAFEAPQNHTNRVRTFHFSPDNSFFVSGSYDGTLKMWRFEAEPEPEPIAEVLPPAQKNPIIPLNDGGSNLPPSDAPIIPQASPVFEDGVVAPPPPEMEDPPIRGVPITPPPPVVKVPLPPKPKTPPPPKVKTPPPPKPKTPKPPPVVKVPLPPKPKTPPPKAPTPPPVVPTVDVNQRKIVDKGDVQVQSAEIIIKIWDEQNEDGDVVSIFLNGACILSAYELKNVKKNVRATITPNQVNQLVMYAHNMGENPPNSAALSIDDGKLIRKVHLESDLEKSESVKILFKVK